jgi:hypothetical protein
MAAHFENHPYYPALTPPKATGEREKERKYLSQETKNSPLLSFSCCF